MKAKAAVLILVLAGLLLLVMPFSTRFAEATNIQIIAKNSSTAALYTTMNSLFPSSAGTCSGVAEGFVSAVDFLLTTVTLRLYQSGSSAGYVRLCTFAISGSWETAIPIGLSLGNSTDIQVSSLPGSVALYNFTFPTMPYFAPGNYFVAIIALNGTWDGSHYVQVARVGTNVTVGNFAQYYSSAWAATATWDLTYYIYGDTDISPSYVLSKTGTNSTLTVAPWLFYSYWWIPAGSLSGFIFSFNASGSFANDTWTSFPAANDTWANVSKTISHNVGIIIAWQVFVNSSFGAWATLPLQYVTLTALLTVYFTSLGAVEINGTVISNGSSILYNTLTPVAHLAATPQLYATFLNFTVNAILIVDNPFNFTVQNTTTIWSYFGSVGAAASYAVARFDFNPTNPAPGTLVVFNATQSYNTTDVSFSWDFGDGNTTLISDSFLVVHSFAANITYVVGLELHGTAAASNSSMFFRSVNVTTASLGGGTAKKVGPADLGGCVIAGVICVLLLIAVIAILRRRH